MVVRLSSFPSDVRATPLTGLALTNSAVVATDSVVVAMGKLQAQLANYAPLSGGAFTGNVSVSGTTTLTGTVLGAGITALHAAPGPIGSTTPSTGAFTTLSASSTVSGSGFFAAVLACVLSGLSTATSAVITTSDSILTALGKLQAQITSLNVLSGTAKYYGAIGNGVANDTTAMQTAATAMAGATLRVTAGTYMISSPIALSANTRLVLDPGAVIKQIASTNMASLIDCQTNTANGCSIVGGTLDGNLANNTTLNGTYGINIGTASDVTVSGVLLTNLSNCSIYVYSGLRPTIEDCQMTNTRGYGCVMFAPPSAQTDTYGIIQNNRFLKPFGAHAIYVQNSDNNIIRDNHIWAQQVTGMTVSVSGTAVTSAGTGINNFLTNTDGGPMQVGSFIILGDGSVNSQIELLITAVNSASSITVSASGGSHTSFSAISGPGDLISISCASFLSIRGNRIRGGSAGGIVVSDFVGGESLQDNQIDGNDVRQIGNCGISIQTSTTAYQAFNNSITNNVITNCGVGGVATTYNSGIALAAFGSDALLDCFVSGNMISNIGGGNTQYWMQLTVPAGSYIMCGHNSNYGMVNQGILNGITSVVLAAGWGSTASVSSIVSQGRSFSFTITSNGTGQSATPTFQVNTAATTAEQPGIVSALMASGTGVIQAIGGEQNTSPGILTLYYDGTPVAGMTYVIYCTN